MAPASFLLKWCARSVQAKSARADYAAPVQIKANLPPPGKNTLVRALARRPTTLHACSQTLKRRLQVMVCGPPPMINRACKPAFAALGYADESLLIW